MTEVKVDLDSIIQSLSELGAQLQNSSEATSSLAATTTTTTSSNSLLRSSSSSSKTYFPRKKTKYNVSFSDKPPVFYESQPQSGDEIDDDEEMVESDMNVTENIYEGIDGYSTLNNDCSISLASLLESRKIHSIIQTENALKSAKLDKELESVLRELDVLREECEEQPEQSAVGNNNTPDEDDDDDDDAPPLPPPPSSAALSAMTLSSSAFDDEYNRPSTASHSHPINHRSSPGSRPDPTFIAVSPHHQRPLSYDSNFSSDSVGTSASTNNDSASSGKSNDSRSSKIYSSLHHSFQHHHNHSNSFSGLSQVSAHPHSVSQVCVKIHSEDGSSKMISIGKDTTIHQLCCILIKKYRHPVSKDWSIVEHWNDINMERLMEGHLKVVEQIKKWPPNSDNKLWFVQIPKKFDLFSDRQVTESLLSDSFVPGCDGPLYMKYDGKKSWKKFHFVLRASGLYYSAKAKTSKLSDLTCLYSLDSVDIFTNLQDWDKRFKAPFRFGFALKSTGVSKTNSQNLVKFLCVEDAKSLQAWVDALRLVKYGKLLYEDYKRPIILPPSVLPQQHPVAASWSNLIEDELDRVAGNQQRLQMSSISLRDCSNLNASIEPSAFKSGRSDSVYSDESPKFHTLANASFSGSRASMGHQPQGLEMRSPSFDLRSSDYQMGLRSRPNIPLTSNVSRQLNMRHSEDIVGTLPRNQLIDGGTGSKYTSSGNQLLENGTPLKLSTSFDRNRLHKTPDVVKSPSLNGSIVNSSDDPLYDYISEISNGQHLDSEVSQRGYQTFQDGAFQNRSLFLKQSAGASLPPPDIMVIASSMSKSKSQDLLEDNFRGERVKHLVGPYGSSTLNRNSLTRKSSLPIDENQAKIDAVIDTKLDFPPPPTPEIFQFLAQKKINMMPAVHHHYEAPSLLHHNPMIVQHDFNRNGSLNRSFVKSSSSLKNRLLAGNVHRASGNSYTPEPGYYSQNLHHTGNVNSQGKQKQAIPVPPPRSSDTKLSNFIRLNSPSTADCTPNDRTDYFDSYDEMTYVRSDNAIKLLNRMVEQKIKMGVDGFRNGRQPEDFYLYELDDLPPPPARELLQALKFTRSQDKQSVVLACNS